MNSSFENAIFEYYNIVVVLFIKHFDIKKMNII